LVLDGLLLEAEEVALADDEAFTFVLGGMELEFCDADPGLLDGTVTFTKESVVLSAMENSVLLVCKYLSMWSTSLMLEPLLSGESSCLDCDDNCP